MVAPGLVLQAPQEQSGKGILRRFPAGDGGPAAPRPNPGGCINFAAMVQESPVAAVI